MFSHWCGAKCDPMVTIYKSSEQWALTVQRLFALHVNSWAFAFFVDPSKHLEFYAIRLSLNWDLHINFRFHLHVNNFQSGEWSIMILYLYRGASSICNAILISQIIRLFNWRVYSRILLKNSHQSIDLILCAILWCWATVHVPKRILTTITLRLDSAYNKLFQDTEALKKFRAFWPIEKTRWKPRNDIFICL